MLIAANVKEIFQFQVILMQGFFDFIFIDYFPV